MRERLTMLLPPMLWPMPMIGRWNEVGKVLIRFMRSRGWSNHDAVDVAGC